VFTDTTATSGTVTVGGGHTYAFYSVARDNVGHVEAPPSAPDTTIQVIGQTTTTIQSSNPSPTYGAPLIFTVTVRAGAPGSGTLAGTVQFVIDGNNYGGPVPLNAGTASIAAALGTGSHTIAANYIDSDGKFLDGTGTLPGGVTVAKAHLTVTAND